MNPGLFNDMVQIHNDSLPKRPGADAEFDQEV